MDYIKLTIVAGLIGLGALAMYMGYDENVFWLVITALAGLGGYEIHKKQEAMKQKQNDVNTARRD